MVPYSTECPLASASGHLEQGSVATVSTALLASVVVDRIELVYEEDLVHQNFEILLMVQAHSDHQATVVGKRLAMDSSLLPVLIQIPVR